MYHNLLKGKSVLVAIVLIVTICATCIAADSTSAHRFCLRDTGPQCTTFLITEAGITHVLDRPLFDAHLNVELGAMHKINDRWSWGGTLNMTYSEVEQEAFLLAIKPRVRNMLCRGIRADLAAGVTFARISNNGEYRVAQPSFTGTVSIGWHDWVSAVLQVEHLRFESGYTPDPAFYPDYVKPPGFNKTNWYIGVSIGSYPGAILAPIVAGLSALAEYADDNWD